jgi:hypothetical protein
MGLLLTFVLVPQVSAHTPAVDHQRRYSADLQSLPYKIDASVPSWLTTAYNTALPTQWATNNNSKSPRYSFSTSGAGTVYFSTMSSCAGVTNWLGCFSGAGTTTWKIWIRNTTSWTYCEASNVTGCFMAKRAILHEGEHVTLTNSHDPQNATLTNMGGCTGGCGKPNAGYDSASPRECDEAALQLEYDLYQFGSAYGDCLDGISNAGSTGLLTGTTLTQTSGTVCTGMSISISGRMAVATFCSYQTLSNNPLALRTIYFDRKLHSSSTWTVDWSSTATSGATSGNNWTKSFTESPGSTTSYDYRVHYKGQGTGLNPSYSATITLTFLNPCPPP